MRNRRALLGDFERKTVSPRQYFMEYFLKVMRNLLAFVEAFVKTPCKPQESYVGRALNL